MTGKGALKTWEKNHPLTAVLSNLSHKVPRFRNNAVEFLSNGRLRACHIWMAQRIGCSFSAGDISVRRESVQINWERHLDLSLEPLGYKGGNLTTIPEVQLLKYQKSWLVIASDISIPVKIVRRLRSRKN